VTPVLVVLAIALLAVGVVTLGIGLFGNTLGWVFVSVGASALALIPLFLLYKRGRQVEWPAFDETVAAEPEDPTDWRSVLGPSSPLSPPRLPEPGPGLEIDGAPGAPAGVGVAGPPAGGSGGGVAAPGGGVAGPAPAGGSVAAPPPAGPNDAPWRPESSSPIAGYDELRVAEILPLLTRLDAAALGEIRRREIAGRARPTILARIEELTAAGRGSGASSEPPGRPGTGSSPSRPPSAGPRPTAAPGSGPRPTPTGGPGAGSESAGVSGPGSGSTSAPSRG
jgi:hypothetical protein